MKIRTIQEKDFQEVAKIELEVWGETGASLEQIKSRFNVFPDGSIVAEQSDGKIVGYAVAQRVNSISNGTWDEQTDNGSLNKTHVANGQIAYGVNMSVLQEAAAMKISKAIIDHYRQIFITEGDCSLLALGSRLPGFSRWKSQHDNDEVSLNKYLSQRFGGYAIDPELRLYEKNGFQVLWPLPNYFPCQESENYGALIVQR